MRVGILCTFRHFVSLYLIKYIQKIEKVGISFENVFPIIKGMYWPIYYDQTKDFGKQNFSTPLKFLTFFADKLRMQILHLHCLVHDGGF